MLFEIISSCVAASLTGWATLHVRGSTDDGRKIARICQNAGLTVKENKQVKTMQLLRKSRRDWGVEYAYRIPLGLSFADFERKREAIQDGLNGRSVLDAKTFLTELRKLKIDGQLIANLQALLKEKRGDRKYVELSYDGVLKVRVYQKELTDHFAYDEALLDSLREWQIPVGSTVTDVIKHDFDKHAHLIVAGMTDYGKSVFLKNIVTSFVAKQPDNVRFALIDLKGGLAFNRFRNLAQVDGVAKNPEEAFELLTHVQAAMEQRMEYLLNGGFEDIKEAGIKDRYFVVIDEAADIASDKDCQAIIADIARRGRGAGFRLIYATQYPTNETLSSQVRQNVSAQVCFRLKTAIASRAVLDEDGAESLPLIKGRAIYRTDRKAIVQTPFITNDFIDKTIMPHINIRTKEAPQHERTPGTDSIVIEETRLS